MAILRPEGYEIRVMLSKTNIFYSSLSSTKHVLNPKKNKIRFLPNINQCLIVGLGWWFGILGVPPSSNPFHKGIPGMQTTNPNQQLNIN